jgi:hypothetical protein
MGGMSADEQSGAIASGSKFVDKMGPADLVAIMTFGGGDVRVVEDFTSDHAKLTNDIQHLYANHQRRNLRVNLRNICIGMACLLAWQSRFRGGNAAVGQQAPAVALPSQDGGVVDSRASTVSGWCSISTPKI